MNFLEWVGVTSLFLLGLCIFLALLGWVVSEVQGFRSRREWRIRVDACGAFSQRLIADSWWFSEDDATMNLIKGLAGNQDVANLREDWRRARVGAGR